MATVEEKEITVWYGIFSDFTIKPYDTPLKKLKNKYWIKQEDTGKRYITPYENTYTFYNFSIYNKSLKPAEIELKGWKIKQIYDPLKVKTAFDSTNGVFTDKNGEMRTKVIHRIENGLNYLKEISGYENWQNYDLKNTNDKITAEIESLREERDILYSNVYSFKNTKLYKKIEEGFEKIDKTKPTENNIQAFCDEFKIDELFIESWFETE